MSTVLPTTSGKPFCEVSSVQPYCSSNLQLFSLRQAFRYWKELQENKATLTPHQVTEYLVFILVCTGTSISQLLGQNAVHTATGTRVDPPKRLFNQVFGSGHSKEGDFKTFIDLYDDCRHFGSPKHPSIASLTEAECAQHLHLVVALWDEIVKKYREEGNDTEDKLADFETVENLV